MFDIMENNGKSGLILIKYGGNAMRDNSLTEAIIRKIKDLYAMQYKVVLVHGGGPFIEEHLKMAGIESEFVAGHRKTTPEAMKYIEMTLQGHVNSNLVRLLNKTGLNAVGLSGKDGNMVSVTKRYPQNEQQENIDIGYVGNVKSVNTYLPGILLNNGFVPVISSNASGPEHKDYNVNADMFAGHLAGALAADHFIMLTDVDGLFADPQKPESLIQTLKLNEIEHKYGSVIKGGMIPKTEACKIAVENGAKSAIITNGTKPENVVENIINTDKARGTMLVH